MTFDWISFFLGMSAGLLIGNLLNILSAYVRLRIAKKAVAVSAAKVKDYQVKLRMEKEKVLGKIKEGENK